MSPGRGTHRALGQPLLSDNSVGRWQRGTERSGVSPRHCSSEMRLGRAWWSGPGAGVQETARGQLTSGAEALTIGSPGRCPFQEPGRPPGHRAPPGSQACCSGPRGPEGSASLQAARARAEPGCGCPPSGARGPDPSAAEAPGTSPVLLTVPIQAPGVFQEWRPLTAPWVHSSPNLFLPAV